MLSPRILIRKFYPYIDRNQEEGRLAEETSGISLKERDIR